MKSLLVALVLTAFTPALPAAGVVLKQGDVLFMWNMGLVHFDPGTGNRQVISGCSDPDTDCVNPSTIIGTGPMWDTGNFPTPLAQPDGSIVLIAAEDNGGLPGAVVAFRVDPANGHRTIIARSDDGKGYPLTNQGNPHTVVPAFSPQLAALPTWGFPALLGLLVGVALRRRPRF